MSYCRKSFEAPTLENDRRENKPNISFLRRAHKSDAFARVWSKLLKDITAKSI